MQDYLSWVAGREGGSVNVFSCNQSYHHLAGFLAIHPV